MAASCSRAARLARQICCVHLRSSTVLAGRFPGRYPWSRMDLLGVIVVPRQEYAEYPRAGCSAGSRGDFDVSL